MGGTTNGHISSLPILTEYIWSQSCLRSLVNAISLSFERFLEYSSSGKENHLILQEEHIKMAKELSQSAFDAEVTNFSGSVLIDFWAPWCGPCRVMGPIVDKLAEKYEGKVKIAKVNVDDNQDLAVKFNVMSIPSILFFKAGKLVHAHTGSTSETELENQIKQHLL